MTARYPLEPVARHLGIHLGGPGGGPRIGDIHPTGLALLAEHLGVSYSTAQRAHRNGLTEDQADRYAVAAGSLPELLWPDYARHVAVVSMPPAAAANALKDRCPRGHPYDRRTPQGWRRCSRCRTTPTATRRPPLTQPANCTPEVPAFMPDEKLLTIRDVARRWQVSESTVKRRVAAGELRPTRLGQLTRFRLQDVEAAEQAAAS